MPMHCLWPRAYPIRYQLIVEEGLLPEYTLSSSCVRFHVEASLFPLDERLLREEFCQALTDAVLDRRSGEGKHLADKLLLVHNLSWLAYLGVHVLSFMFTKRSQKGDKRFCGIVLLAVKA